jgi:CRISPR-associated protein Cmr3
MTHTRFIEPLDVLFLRGNRLFGDPGSYGESLLPPWPSVAAGALRSLLYASNGKVLDDPEDFRLTAFHIARRQGQQVEAVYPLPADVVISGECRQTCISRLHPAAFVDGIATSSSLPMTPILAERQRSKPQSGFWLAAAGWKRYLAGETPTQNDLIRSKDLWQMETRVGLGIEPEKRRADDGKLFSMQAIAFRCGVGFIAASMGRVTPPETGILRIGGDGRAAALSSVSEPLLRADHAAIAQARRARLILTTPGLFSAGWRLPGMSADGYWELAGVRARVVAAAVPRAEVVSGWDMVKKRPKPARRVAPTGSVYWLEDIQADGAALDKLADHGLWPETAQDTARRIEGFNRLSFAAY